MRRLLVVVALLTALCLLTTIAYAAGVGANGARRVPVLLYHRIVPTEARTPLEVSAGTFASQMGCLKRLGFHLATADEVEEFAAGRIHLPRRSVLVTFDDGYEDNYTLAFPIFQQYGAKATVFVITSLVGKPGYLTPDQIEEMTASGLVDFQLHTDALHYQTADGQSAVLAVPPAGLITDLNTARLKLMAWTGKRPHVFAYPFGFYNDRVAEPLKTAGVTSAYTVEPGYVRPGDSMYKLHRIPVFGVARHRYLQRLLGLRFFVAIEGFAFR